MSFERERCKEQSSNKLGWNPSLRSKTGIVKTTMVFSFGCKPYIVILIVRFLSPLEL
jgi:hypothetical protein